MFDKTLHTITCYCFDFQFHSWSLHHQQDHTQRRRVCRPLLFSFLSTSWILIYTKLLLYSCIFIQFLPYDIVLMARLSDEILFQFIHLQSFFHSVVNFRHFASPTLVPPGKLGVNVFHFSAKRGLCCLKSQEKLRQDCPGDHNVRFWPIQTKGRNN